MLEQCKQCSHQFAIFPSAEDLKVKEILACNVRLHANTVCEVKLQIASESAHKVGGGQANRNGNQIPISFLTTGSNAEVAPRDWRLQLR
jgi:hypothetical protein